MWPCKKWSIVVVTATCVLIGAAAAPQVDVQRALDWHLRVQKAEHIPRAAVQTYRSYVETPRIDLRMTLANDSDEAIYLDDTLVRQALRLRVESIDDSGTHVEVPVTVEWPGVLLTNMDPVQTVPNQLLFVESHSVAMWGVVIRRTDDLIFTAGTYRLEFQLINIASAARTLSGEAWMGRTPVRPSEMRVIVRTPSTPRESSIMHVLDGLAAGDRERWQEALAAYVEAVRVDPSHLGAVARLGQTYVRLGRYKEAVSALAGSPLGPESVESLVLAYVGVGDEQGAVNVLRSAGRRSEDQIVSRLRAAREVVRSRPAR